MAAPHGRWKHQVWQRLESKNLISLQAEEISMKCMVTLCLGLFLKRCCDPAEMCWARALLQFWIFL